MKVLHVTFTYAPDPPGGTEVYVSRLCRDLSAAGISCVIAAPARDNDDYAMDGIRVRRFACSPEHQPLETLYGGGDPTATAGFERVLAEEQPDIVHQHALSPACSVDLVRRARARSIPVVFTIHTPAVFCQRGSFLRWGLDMCDVGWGVDVCTPCVLDGLGTGPLLGGLVAGLPAPVGRMVRRSGLAGGIWTALQMPALMRQRLAALDEMFSSVSRIVSLAEWTTALLTRHGVPDEKIIYSPHGVDVVAPPSPAARNPGPLALVHLGRLDSAKGTALLVRAVASDPSLAVTLDIFGVRQAASAETVQHEVREIAARDSRIRLHDAVNAADVPATLQQFDLLLVPSQVAETGPLVVLEAFAAGIPVVGSRLAGIAEKIRDGVDGLLVDPFGSEAAWRAAVRRCATEPELLARLRQGIRPPRTAEAVAVDMHDLYHTVAGRDWAPGIGYSGGGAQDLAGGSA